MIHSPPSPTVESMIQVAAEMRAAGSNWESVGTKVGRRPETCRRWPAIHPELWKRHFRAAATQFAEDCATEARVFLRMLARSQDEKVRLQACKIMLQTCMDLRKLEANMPAPELEETEWLMQARTLDRMSPEEIERLGDDAADTSCLRRGWTPPPEGWQPPVDGEEKLDQELASPKPDLSRHEPPEPACIGGSNGDQGAAVVATGFLLSAGSPVSYNLERGSLPRSSSESSGTTS